MSRCILCGGPVGSNGKCRECGMDNTKNDSRYRLNRHNDRELLLHGGSCEDNLNKDRGWGNLTGKSDTDQRAKQQETKARIKADLEKRAREHAERAQTKTDSAGEGYDPYKMKSAGNGYDSYKTDAAKSVNDPYKSNTAEKRYDTFQSTKKNDKKRKERHATGTVKRKGSCLGKLLKYGIILYIIYAILMTVLNTVVLPDYMDAFPVEIEKEVGNADIDWDNMEDLLDAAEDIFVGEPMPEYKPNILH